MSIQPAARRLGMLALLVLLASCAASGPTPAPRAPVTGLLRVGVTPGRPPYVLRREGRLTGLEIDMAVRLAQGLSRRLELVELEWDQLIPALLAGRIDAIMSGMTVTAPRRVQVAFADPYLHSGLAFVMRRADRALYPDLAAVTARTSVVGVVAGTTSERWAREQMPRTTLQVYPTPAAAAVELTQNRIDLLLTDLAIGVWMVSQDEGALALLRRKIGDEPLAWAFRPADDVLREAADGVLAGWRQDGTLATLLQRWLPYWAEVR